MTEGGGSTQREPAKHRAMAIAFQRESVGAMLMLPYVTAQTGAVVSRYVFRKFTVHDNTVQALNIKKISRFIHRPNSTF